MATFTNQATLSYNGTVVTSNIVTGELVDALSVTKTAVLPTYGVGDTVTYIVSLVNSGTAALTGVSVSDNLGAYAFGTGVLVPLEYIDGSVKYYANGVLQAAPAVTAGPPLTVTGLSVPAGGNAILVYAAALNEYAPLGEGGEITNAVSVTGAGLPAPIVAEETVTAGAGQSVRITKALEPTTVAEGDLLTYTLTVENYGTTPIIATDNAVVSDNFAPILNPITVTLNGVTVAEGTAYTYDEATGAFSTLPGVLTVPAATYTQDPVSGAWAVVPGVAVLVISGIVSLA